MWLRCILPPSSPGTPPVGQLRVRDARRLRRLDVLAWTGPHLGDGGGVRSSASAPRPRPRSARRGVAGGFAPRRLDVLAWTGPHLGDGSDQHLLDRRPDRDALPGQGRPAAGALTEARGPRLLSSKSDTTDLGCSITAARGCTTWRSYSITWRSYHTRSRKQPRCPAFFETTGLAPNPSCRSHSTSSFGSNRSSRSHETTDSSPELQARCSSTCALPSSTSALASSRRWRSRFLDDRSPELDDCGRNRR
jgi:hypothetical protein